MVLKDRVAIIEAKLPLVVCGVLFQIEDGSDRDATFSQRDVRLSTTRCAGVDRDVKISSIRPAFSTDSNRNRRNMRRADVACLKADSANAASEVLAGIQRGVRIFCFNKDLDAEIEIQTGDDCSEIGEQA